MHHVLPCLSFLLLRVSVLTVGHVVLQVLGDRSLKYKYLNPNTLFIATGSPAGVDADGDDAPLTAHIIDAVTGRMLHRQSHIGGRGPVHAVMSENWVVYQFWNSIATKYEVTVIEVFDATPREFDVVHHLLHGTEQQPLTSFNDTSLEVLSQSYYNRMPLVGLDVTRTARGITTKNLLMLMASNQVYAMDKRFVDPRRPHKAKLSAEEQEERLLPYSDMLPVMPASFATFNHTIAGLRGVVVTPSNLESTCLMFAHGTDLYATRLTPAKDFDALGHDFNYGLLVLMLITLVVATVVVHHLTKRALLKQKWQ